MKKIKLLLVLSFFSLGVSAQIDGNLLLGLVSATTSEINAITNAVEGSLIYNAEEEKMYINTASGFIKIPSVDTNSVDFWSATGSSGTNAALNFLGTTDAQDMVFRSNNIEAIRILQTNQNVGIGTSNPDELLHVDGTMRLNGGFEDKDGDSGTAGQILSSTATGTDWITFSGSGGSISTDANNSLSIGSDTGIFYESPVKAHGKISNSGAILNASGIASAIQDATGQYTVVLSTARPTADYTIQLNVLQPASSNKLETIVVTNQTTTGFSVEIADMRNGNGGGSNKGAVDLDWYFTILD